MSVKKSVGKQLSKLRRKIIHLQDQIVCSHSKFSLEWAELDTVINKIRSVLNRLQSINEFNSFVYGKPTEEQICQDCGVKADLHNMTLSRQWWIDKLTAEINELKSGK